MLWISKNHTSDYWSDGEKKGETESWRIGDCYQSYRTFTRFRSDVSPPGDSLVTAVAMHGTISRRKTSNVVSSFKSRARRRHY